jgi:hypothetical protein
MSRAKKIARVSLTVSLIISVCAPVIEVECLELRLPSLEILLDSLYGGTTRYEQKQPPLMLDQIKELVAILPDVALAGEIKDRGVNFQVTEQAINELKRLGVGSQTLKIIGSFTSNRPPTAVFSFEQPDVQYGQVLTIFADARDPDNDQLQYFWAASAGSISDNGVMARLDTSTINMRPNAAEVVVTVTVIDRKGGSDSYSRSIIVRRRSIETNASENEQSHLEGEPRTAQEAWLEGKYTIVRLTGEADKTGASWGFIEVAVNISANGATLRSVTGVLPGRLCRVDIVARENVTEYSFKEPPGSFNKWRSVLVRVRPKDSKRVVRFAIYWQVLQHLGNQ